jgi:hypothetical protein
MEAAVHPEADEDDDEGDRGSDHYGDKPSPGPPTTRKGCCIM